MRGEAPSSPKKTSFNNASFPHDKNEPTPTAHFSPVSSIDRIISCIDKFLSCNDKFLNSIDNFVNSIHRHSMWNKLTQADNALAECSTFVT